MSSPREFYTRILPSIHSKLLTKFLEKEEIDNIDVDVSDKLAEIASLIAARLTVSWEDNMVWCEENDNDPESEACRENSTTDLCKPFNSVEEEMDNWKN